MTTIPFNKPPHVGRELDYISDVVKSGHLCGDGKYSKLCSSWLRETYQTNAAFLTHSCTAALEMGAILANVKPGDEVIMPSFTFVSTANAFVLRGAVPVFVDVRADTLNIDETLIEAACTAKTKAIVPVHYAGVSCAMTEIMATAKRRSVIVIEDAAQALHSRYKGQLVGTLGHVSAFSFHETKNVVSGEGGALLVNDASLVERAAVIREKGTNRSAFLRGFVDKYTWVDVGSSFLPGELVAAFLYAQLEHSKAMIESRGRIWRSYHAAFAELEARGVCKRPSVPADCEANYHIYYLLLDSIDHRDQVIAGLKALGVGATFHYVPLHSSPAGQRYGRAHGDLRNTDRVYSTLVRLPLWSDMTESNVDQVVSAVKSVLRA